MKPQEPKHERPRQPGKIRSVLLALAVHGAFFALIVFGVTWQSRPTPPLQAELWDKLPPGPPAAAKKAAPEPPPPEPEPAPPKAEPKPEPPKAEPRPEPPKPEAKPEPPRPDPAIAEKKEREKKEREKKELEKKELEKREQAKKELAKKEQERKEREAKAAAEAKAKAEARAKTEAEAQAKAAAEAAEQARVDEFNRYVDGIRAKIRGKANVPDTVRGNPTLQVRITILPGGEVLDVRVVQRSANPAYDEAILRAIRSASPLNVPPANSELFPKFRDLILNITHER